LSIEEIIMSSEERTKSVGRRDLMRYGMVTAGIAGIPVLTAARPAAAAEAEPEVSIIGVDPLTTGASADADSSAAFVLAAQKSKVIRLRPGATYRLTKPAVLPAGTVVEGNGATLQLLLLGSLVLNERCLVRGIVFANANTQDFVGQETCLTVQGPGVVISGNSFTGGGYRKGIVLQTTTKGGGSVDDCTIEDNTFTNTSFGVLKQGGPVATPTTGNNIRIVGNRFTTIRRGDAIELNAGADTGGLIADNVIDDVHLDNTTNAGFGIGIAGLGGYAQPEGTHYRRFRVVDNIITNCEAQGIHVEIGARFDISGNHVEQTADALKGTGQGIISYGGINGSVTDNTVIGFGRGIMDGMGALNNSYIVASDKNWITGNRVVDCSVGVFVETSGQGKSSFVTKNLIEGCTVGIQLAGSSNSFYIDNQLLDCATPFVLDANPASMGQVAATTRRVHLSQNLAVTLNGTSTANRYSNFAGTEVTGSGNSFPLPS
jgi:hypothetical protein